MIFAITVVFMWNKVLIELVIREVAWTERCGAAPMKTCQLPVMTLLKQGKKAIICISKISIAFLKNLYHTMS